MMAAFSTILGMFPLLSDSFFQGMAVTIMFGLAVASVITLVITPVLYAIFFRINPPGITPGASSPLRRTDPAES
jgi:multidrug efflux pump subunit AcrB